MSGGAQGIGADVTVACMATGESATVVTVGDGCCTAIDELDDDGDEAAVCMTAGVDESCWRRSCSCRAR